MAQAAPDTSHETRLQSRHRRRIATLRELLRRQIHRPGRRHEPAALCQLVTGAPLSSAPFLAYLERKLSSVYRL
jgi:Zn-dependent M32 family carboxypeptidase